MKIYFKKSTPQVYLSPASTHSTFNSKTEDVCLRGNFPTKNRAHFRKPINVEASRY